MASDSDLVFQAGLASTDLIAHPTAWINRRVETIEMLDREETRRRVSVDFTLSEEQQAALTLHEGVVVPISVLTKEARRNFDLRDETGRALPVLTKQQNGSLAHIAVLNAATQALPGDLSEDAIQMLAADLRQVVFAPPAEASQALEVFLANADDGDPVWGAIRDDPVSEALLSSLWENYVLFAVLAPGGGTRRILKFSYGDDFDLSGYVGGTRERFTPTALARRAWWPDRRQFHVECSGAWRSASFHAEIAIPEELRVAEAFLYDLTDDLVVSDGDVMVNRAALYASEPITEEHELIAFVELVPERAGNLFQAAATATVVAALLWLGVASGLDAENPGPAVSLVLAGAALFSGLTARAGEHRLVTAMFKSTRRWLAVVTLAALFASVSLALEFPYCDPVDGWRWAALACTAAALRLGWSTIRDAS